MDPARADRTSVRTFAFVLAGGLLVGLVTLFASEARSRRSPRTDRVASVEDSSVVPAAPRVPVEELQAEVASVRAGIEVVAPEEAPPRQPTAREYLADYYGGRWTEIEAKMVAAGLNLDQPYWPRRWEDVEGEFEDRIGLNGEQRLGLMRQQIRWPETLTPEYLNQTFPLPAPLALDETDVSAIEVLVAEKNGEIGHLAEYYSGLIDHFVHETWRTGDYVRAPFATAGLSDERGFHSQSHAGGGWAVSITLSREKYPEAAEIEQRMTGLCLERNQLVANYVRAQFGVK